MVLAPAERVPVLVVSTHPEDFVELCAMLPAAQWDVHAAASWSEAATMLRAEPDAVVITETELADQSWKSILDLLSAVEAKSGFPKLIVTSSLADDQLWSEVLNCGGFNVLAKPFDPFEVDWVLTQARISPSSRPQ